MSTLSVATVETEDGLTDLTLKTGNTSGPSITIYAGNGEIAFNSTSNMSFTATAIDYSGVVTYTGNIDFSSANVTGIEAGISTGKAIAMAIVFG